jgi:hypothetical protein
VDEVNKGRHLTPSPSPAGPGSLNAQAAEGLREVAAQTGDPRWRAVAAGVDGRIDTDAELRASMVRERAKDRYDREASAAARSYLGTWRGIWISFAALGLSAVASVGGFIFGITWLGPRAFASVAQLPLVFAISLFSMCVARAAYTRMWIDSLRSLMGYTPVPADVSATTYARAVLTGEHAAGELERSLVALWQANDEEAQKYARGVLARRSLPDPSDSGAGYQRDPESEYPLWRRDGVAWRNAPAVDSEHDCSPWTIAVVDPGTETVLVTFRCVCGRVSYGS